MTPEELAAAIINVQPMPSDIFKRLREEAMSEKDLVESGYRPVSSLGLMWIKDEEKTDD